MAAAAQQNGRTALRKITPVAIGIGRRYLWALFTRRDLGIMWMKARLVRVSVEATENRLYATSADLPGLFVSEKTPEALEAALPGAIELVFAADGVKVLATELEGMDAAGYKPWVAVPTLGSVSQSCG